MKFVVLLSPILLLLQLLGDTISHYTTIFGNGASASIAVYIPPEQELEVKEVPRQHEKNKRTESDIDSENHSRSHTTPSHVPFENDKEIRSGDFETHVKKSFHPWSANGSGVISDGFFAPKQSKQPVKRRASGLLQFFRKRKIHELPESYDARIAYPYCKSITSIIHQSNCGSCWAIAVAAAFSDRLCIQSRGKVNYNMSAIHLVSCCEESSGCFGGLTTNAWKYIEKNGLVTGGDYGSSEVTCLHHHPFHCVNDIFTGCQPYPFYPLKRKSDNTRATTPKCSRKRCPISYKGIYRKSESPETVPRAHTVRIIGWGEEDDQKYWIVANSYGKEWGEDGFFKIPRGINYCKIETFVSCATPVIEQSTFSWGFFHIKSQNANGTRN